MRIGMNISNEDCQQVQWRSPSLAGWVGRLIRASHPSDTPLAYWPNTSQEQSILSVIECARSNIDQIYTVWLLFPLKYVYVCNRQQTEEPKMISTCGVIDILSDRTRIHNNFFCLGTQPSQFIEVLNIWVLRPYQHVKHWIKLTMRPGVTCMLLKFLVRVDTADWRHSSRQLVWFSLAFPLDSFSRTCSNSFSRSMLTTIVAGNRF